jgi:hypothetical protein
VTDEEARAVAYLQAQQRRAATDAARRAALAGDAGARTDLDSRWAPLRAWLDEHREA